MFIEQAGVVPHSFEKKTSIKDFMGFLNRSV